MANDKITKAQAKTSAYLLKSFAASIERCISLPVILFLILRPNSTSQGRRVIRRKTQVKACLASSLKRKLKIPKIENVIKEATQSMLVF